MMLSVDIRSTLQSGGGFPLISAGNGPLLSRLSSPFGERRDLTVVPRAQLSLAPRGNDRGGLIGLTFAFSGGSSLPKRDTPISTSYRGHWVEISSVEPTRAFGRILVEDTNSAVVSVAVELAQSESIPRFEVVHVGPLNDDDGIKISLSKNSPLKLEIIAGHSREGYKVVGRKGPCRVSCGDRLEKEDCIECDLGDLIIRTCC